MTNSGSGGWGIQTEGSMKADRIRVWLAFIIVSTVWGSTWLAIKIGLETIPPFFSVNVRLVIAELILGAVLVWRKERIPWTRNARRVYLSMGLLTFALPFALVYWGQQYISSSLACILWATFPFCVALVSWVWVPSVRLHRYTVLGIVLGFLGVLIIFGGDLQVSDPRALWGMVAILGSVGVQAISLVQVKVWGEDVSPVAMNFIGMLIGLVALFVLGVSVEGIPSVTWTFPAVLSILYLAAFGSVLAFLAYYWLLKRIDPVYLSMTSFINPIVGVVLGAVVLHEALRTSLVAGALLVLGGILLANWKSLAVRLRGR
jgi:drug/metabolite transporter (DMT)-like permease